jgi:hypothetical protein
VPLPLSTDTTDISITITALAVPAHTRGSLTYALEYPTSRHGTTGVALFTGDTIFSGGAGVAFEADLNRTTNGSSATQTKHLTAHSDIAATTTANAVERCFAHVLFHATTITRGHRDDILLFPGHEYSADLLSRQLHAAATKSANGNHFYPQARWKTLPPGDFFDTAAAWYVADHRKETARLLAVPSTIERELHVNPHFRSMRQRGTLILHALRLWHGKFAEKRTTVAAEAGPYVPYTTSSPTSISSAFYSSSSSSFSIATSLSHQQPEQHQPLQSQQPKTLPLPPKQNQWNVTVADVQRPVFTTVYAAELQQVIEELQSNVIDAVTAADRLQQLPNALHRPLIGRRPVPNTNPSGRAVHRGLLALVLLGSPPAALCASDAERLHLDAPHDSDFETIRIDQRRLIGVLHALGLLGDDDGQQLVVVIQQLWRETLEYAAFTSSNDSTCRIGEEPRTDEDDKDVEKSALEEGDGDYVELGDLKWVLYGIPRRPKPSFGSWCRPCRQAVDDRPQPPHPAARLLRHSGTYHTMIVLMMWALSLSKCRPVRLTVSLTLLYFPPRRTGTTRYL